MYRPPTPTPLCPLFCDVTEFGCRCFVCSQVGPIVHMPEGPLQDFCLPSWGFSNSGAPRNASVSVPGGRTARCVPAKCKTPASIVKGPPMRRRPARPLYDGGCSRLKRAVRVPTIAASATPANTAPRNHESCSPVHSDSVRFLQWCL